ncbi:unnamed protein product, partial [marine sediment metagenome]
QTCSTGVNTISDKMYDDKTFSLEKITRNAAKHHYL